MTNFRFTVELASEGSYWVKDNQANKWNMPEKAVSLYFGNSFGAAMICAALNDEWRKFLENPS